MERILENMTAQSAINELKRFQICKLQSSDFKREVYTGISVKTKKILSKMSIKLNKI